MACLARAALLVLTIALVPSCGSSGFQLPSGGTSEDARLDEARLERYKGNRRRAFELYHQVYYENPNSYEAWEESLFLASSEKEMKRVLEDLERAWHRFDADERIMYETLKLGLEKDTGVREQSLFALLEKAGNSDVRAWPQTGLGYLFFQRGSLEAAVDAFGAAAKIAPDLASAHLARARALMQLGRHEQATVDLEHYLILRPWDPAALYNLAWILLNVRNAPRSARPYLERARAVTPGDVAILLALGAVALRADPPDLHTAKDCYETALKTDNDDPDVWMNLGVYHADFAHNPKTAVACFKRYVELGGKLEERALRWIRELGGKVEER